MILNELSSNERSFDTRTFLNSSYLNYLYRDQFVQMEFRRPAGRMSSSLQILSSQFAQLIR